MTEPMTPERLAEIRALSQELRYPTPEASDNARRELLAEVGRLNGELANARTIIRRVTAQMEEYEKYGTGMVNIRQVLNLLSPTWPDGNYAEGARR